MGKKEVIYLAVFVPVGNGAYSIYFPDVPGCASGGDNFMHAKEMAHEALQLHLDWMVRDGDEIPESTLRLSEENLEGDDDCIVVGIKVLLPL